MAIANIQTINVGLPNESVGSDSLYVAFTKTQTNFQTLATYASPYTNFAGGNGITASANSTSNTVTITNTGVTSLIAGTGITLSGNTGAVTISSNGGGNGSGGTVTSVGITTNSSRLVANNTPIVSSGNISLDLAQSGVNAGSYTNPLITVDPYGRITSATNGNSIANVGITPGNGIVVTNNSSNGNYQFTVTNNGVLALSAGTGIQLSGNTGVVTISSPVTGGTVTYVGVTSSTLNVTGSPIATAGTIDIEIPNTVSITGDLTLNATGNIILNSAGGTPEIVVNSSNITINGGGGNAEIVVSANVTNITGDIVGTGNVQSNNLISNNIVIFAGSENLANGSAASLTLDTSYFTTTGASTATLAAGTNGQRKVFAMLGYGGNMVITVTNAAWKSSGTGTITFSAIGQACTLQYIANKWFATGGASAVTFG